MKLFFAIDIYNRRCVRLLHGDKNKLTDYGDPVEMAKKFEYAGAKNLHIVDLNAAFDSTDKTNYETIKKISQGVSIPFQLGGGIRTMEDIDFRLGGLGAARVILGTVAYNNPQLLKEAIKKYGGERIAVGMDARDGFIAIKGWTEVTKVTVEEMGRKLKDMGVTICPVTDISQDGALTGVNIELCRRVADLTGLKVIASGGVKDIADIRNLKKHNIYGAIMGRSLYEGTIKIEEAVKEQE